MKATRPHMPPARGNTVTRDQLVEATRLTIDQVARRGFAPSQPELADELMDLARSMKVVTGYWWEPQLECGCLVGTWLHNEGRSIPSALDEDHWLHLVGVTFPTMLRAVTGLTRVFDVALRVIDDA